MLLSRSWLALASVALTTGLVAGGSGCVYDNDAPRRLGGDSPGIAAAGTGGTSGGAVDGASLSPMLVTVDTDQTLNAAGGDGVGVFVEYSKGGVWHLWWTCDTNKTTQNCDFQVTAKVATGAITNVDASQLPGGFVTTPSPSEVDAQATVTTAVTGLHFQTDPGAVLTVSASVGGFSDGSFLFFVENGQLNGGFQGTLTNPLQFQGSTP